jgi:hypothetical protein
VRPSKTEEAELFHLSGCCQDFGTEFSELHLSHVIDVVVSSERG